MCVPIGVEAIAIGFAVASFLAAFISILANRIIFKLSIFKQLSNMLIPLAISIPMFAFVYRIGEQTSLPVWLTLIIQVISGIFIYLFGLFAVDSNTVLQIKKIIKSFKKGKAKQ